MLASLPLRHGPGSETSLLAPFFHWPASESRSVLRSGRIDEPNELRADGTLHKGSEDIRDHGGDWGELL